MSGLPSRSMALSITSGIVPGMVSSTPEKVRENRLRRMAERQGLSLVKSRRRDPRAIDFGMYFLVDAQSSGIVAGTEGTGRANFTLDDVESYLTQGSER
jgi:hypothetical protein